LQGSLVLKKKKNTTSNEFNDYKEHLILYIDNFLKEKQTHFVNTFSFENLYIFGIFLGKKKLLYIPFKICTYLNLFVNTFFSRKTFVHTLSLKIIEENQKLILCIHTLSLRIIENKKKIFMHSHLRKKKYAFMLSLSRKLKK